MVMSSDGLQRHDISTIELQMVGLLQYKKKGQLENEFNTYRTERNFEILSGFSEIIITSFLYYVLTLALVA